eukprot:1139988-Pelagomonas_calceolata.AAC.1
MGIRRKEKEKNYLGSENTSSIDQGKGDKLARGAVTRSLPHQRIRGRLVWVRWGSGSTRPQGTRVLLSVFDGDQEEIY